MVSQKIIKAFDTIFDTISIWYEELSIMVITSNSCEEFDNIV